MAIPWAWFEKKWQSRPLINLENACGFAPFEFDY
jgi:hypothetical protein